MANWIRPATVSIPTVWSTFQGKIVTDGLRKTYWVQDVTDEYKDRIVQYMIEEFVLQEPTFQYNPTYNPTVPENRSDLKRAWENCLSHNLSLVCLTKDEDGKPTIAGINCTAPCTKYDNKEAAQGLEILQWAKDQVDVFSKFNITEYLDGVGLYVPPKFRGEGIGTELLKARKPLCLACGLKASVTVFSSKYSQRAAECAGFKDIFSIDYDELEAKNPMFRYRGIKEHTKILRFMYTLYE